jgi:hypothetical protein
MVNAKGVAVMMEATYVGRETLCRCAGGHVIAI